MQILAFLFFALVMILAMSVMVAMLSGNAARIAQALRGDEFSPERGVKLVNFQHEASIRRLAKVGTQAARDWEALPLAA
jgi:hypothetical protein